MSNTKPSIDYYLRGKRFDGFYIANCDSENNTINLVNSSKQEFIAHFNLTVADIINFNTDEDSLFLAKHISKMFPEYLI